MRLDIFIMKKYDGKKMHVDALCAEEPGSRRIYLNDDAIYRNTESSKTLDPDVSARTAQLINHELYHLTRSFIRCKACLHLRSLLRASCVFFVPSAILCAYLICAIVVPSLGSIDTLILTAIVGLSTSSASLALFVLGLVGNKEEDAAYECEEKKEIDPELFDKVIGMEPKKG